MRRLLTIAACVLLAAGCAVNQARERELYRAEVELRPPETLATTLTLTQALLLANRQNENISIRGEAYLRTLIERRRAAANFLPTVNLVSSYIRRDEADGSASSASSSRTSASGTSTGGGTSSSGTDSTGNSDGSGNSNNNSGSSSGGSTSGSGSGSAGNTGGSAARTNTENYSFTLNSQLRWNIFNGFQDWNAYWRNTFLVEQRRNDLLQFQEDLLLDVANVFFQLQRSAATVRVLENSVAVQQARLADTQARQEVGFARSLDVAQTRAQLASTQTSLINARRDVATARELLGLLIGGRLENQAIADEFTPPEIESSEAYLKLARARRSDLRAAEAAEAAAHRDVKIALGQYYPSITLTGDAFLLSEPIPTERDWQAALNATLPIFDAGRIHADVREAWSFVREAQLVQSYLTRQIDQEVLTAFENARASAARREQLHFRLDAARQAYTQAEASYSVGLATNLDRVTAQDTLLNAELESSSEEFDYKALNLRLLKATGSLRLWLEAASALPAGTPAMQTEAHADHAASLQPSRQPPVPME